MNVFETFIDSALAVSTGYRAGAFFLGLHSISASVKYTAGRMEQVAKDQLLKTSFHPSSICYRQKKWGTVDSWRLVPGDLVLLVAGSSVPADCYVTDGTIRVDQSSMTGESLPVIFRPGDTCKMLSTVVSGVATGTVESTGANTFFGMTAAMLQSFERAGSCPWTSPARRGVAGLSAIAGIATAAVLLFRGSKAKLLYIYI